MPTICWLILLSGAIPFWHAWRANRRTSLLQAVYWAAGAWAGWGAVMLAAVIRPESDTAALRYLALCLTACAGMAVLGARRPGVGAWNFVVVGLLAVLLLPLAQGLENLRYNLMQVLFLSATLAVGVLNYLPTRLAPTMLLLVAGCAVEIVGLAGSENLLATVDRGLPLGRLALAFAPWVAYVAFRGRAEPNSEFDRIWLGFRDRFGLLWGQRVREQFNRTAANAGWPVCLRWGGLRLTRGASLPDAKVQDEIVKALQSLLKRFGPA